MGTGLFPNTPDITLCHHQESGNYCSNYNHIKQAMGPDQIPTKLLKVGAEEHTPGITLVFQASIDQHTIHEWKKANVDLPSRRKIEANQRTIDQYH